jgi:AraC-like DNA-binding protein
MRGSDLNYTYAKVNSAVHTQNVSMHAHKDVFGSFGYELVYVTGGKGYHIMGTQLEPISVGNYFFIDTGSPHGYKIDEGERLELLNFIFDFRALDLKKKKHISLSEIATGYGFGGFSVDSELNGYVFCDDGDFGTLSLFKKAKRELKEEKIGVHQIVKGTLTEILIKGFRIYSESTQMKSYSPEVIEAVRRIDANYMLPISLSDIAEDEGISIPQLSVKFKKEVGIGFLDYLHKRRINAGCRLLLTTLDPIEIIAERVGYSDAKKFRHRFKSEMGITPREYRRSAM